MSSCSDLISSESPNSLEQIIFAFFEEYRDSPPQDFWENFPWVTIPEIHGKQHRPTSFPPLANGRDYIDGHFSARSSAATTGLLRGSHIRGNQGYYFSDANRSDAGGNLTLDPSTGLLSLTDGRGELFYKINRRWIVDASGQIVGECFSLQSSSNKQLYLALNKDSPNFIVQGMTTKAMGDISNCYWRYIPFSDIGYSPPGSGYIALQYWGNHFGPPNSAPYYFVMDMKSSAPFRIAPKESAAEHGRIGQRDSRS